MRTLSIIKILVTIVMGSNAWFLSFLAIASSISVVATTYSSSPSKYTSAILTVNSSCHRDSDCINDRYPTYLKCVTGRCTCELHAFYDEYDGQCRIRRPSLCVIRRSPSELVQPCVRYAVCSYPIDHNGNELKTAKQGTCECLINKSKNADGTCSGSHPATLSPVSTPLITIGLLFSIFMIMMPSFQQSIS